MLELARRFGSAVSASRPLRLEVRSPNEAEPRLYEFEKPYAVLGRCSRCDVPLTGRRVSYRHAYLQVIEGRVACFDLFSGSGLEWERTASGPWLGPDNRIRVGEHWVRLLDDGWSASSEFPSPLEFRPHGTSPPVYGNLPSIELTILNGDQQGRSIHIKRLLTYIGRDARCRIVCNDNRVSRVHCALLLTPAGLWVVDLFSRRGTLVDESPRPFEQLGEGSKLKIGSLRISVAVSESLQRRDDAKSDTDDPEFLMRQHKVFHTEASGRVLIVRPQGDTRQFNYQQIHEEYGRVLRLLETGRLEHVIVDFSDVELVGSVVLGSISRFCRAASGKAALCCACPNLLESLEVANIPRVWPHFSSRQEALDSVLSEGG